MHFPFKSITCRTLRALCCPRSWVCPLALVLSLVLVVDTLRAQLPRIESIDVQPFDPTLADPVTLSISGMIDTVTGAQIIRSPWRIENTDILLDLLLVEFAVGAPPVPDPFTDQTEIGFLPAGSYNVTARVFRVIGDPALDPFPELWEFPDTFMDDEPYDTMTAQFTVVPEPSSACLAIFAAVTLTFFSRKRRRAKPS